YVFQFSATQIIGNSNPDTPSYESLNQAGTDERSPSSNQNTTVFPFHCVFSAPLLKFLKTDKFHGDIPDEFRTINQVASPEPSRLFEQAKQPLQTVFTY